MAGRDKAQKALDQRPAVSRGEFWDIIQSSIAQPGSYRPRRSPHGPSSWWFLKPNTQGETRARNLDDQVQPLLHTANAASAAIAQNRNDDAGNVGVSGAAPEAKPSSPGDSNRIAPRTRFATSQNFAFVNSPDTLHWRLRIHETELMPSRFHVRRRQIWRRKLGGC